MNGRKMSRSSSPSAASSCSSRWCSTLLIILHVGAFSTTWGALGLTTRSSSFTDVNHLRPSPFLSPAIPGSCFRCTTDSSSSASGGRRRRWDERAGRNVGIGCSFDGGAPHVGTTTSGIASRRRGWAEENDGGGEGGTTVSVKGTVSESMTDSVDDDGRANCAKKSSLSMSSCYGRAGARRKFLTLVPTFLVAAAGSMGGTTPPLAWAEEEQPSSSSPSSSRTTTTSNAVITDKIYLDFRGISDAGTAADQRTTASSGTANDSRIVIGLFGNDASQPVSILKQLSDPKGGYMSPCKPREERMLQKEQLEANKVYNSCMEGGDKGVTYDFSQVWRIVPNERIDVGAVTGKFVARVYPTFEGKDNGLRHDVPGTVSVRRGNDGGFGFTMYPGAGGGGGDDGDVDAARKELDEENIVVGRVIEGMDVLERLNASPVFQSSKLNYMALSGSSARGRKAPSRSCRYGSGELYCNEFKPLKKILITNTGVL